MRVWQKKGPHGEPGKWQATLRTPAGKHTAQGDTMVEAMQQVFHEALYAVEYIESAQKDGRAMVAGHELH